MIVHRRLTKEEATNEANLWYNRAKTYNADVQPPVAENYGEGLKVFRLAVSFDLHYLIFKDSPNEEQETNKS